MTDERGLIENRRGIQRVAEPSARRVVISSRVHRVPGVSLSEYDWQHAAEYLTPSDKNSRLGAIWHDEDAGRGPYWPGESIAVSR